MNILGVGGAELLAILLIMLVVAGPKRMVQWAYVLGRYTAKMRMIWAETMALIEHELNESGVDVKLPREVPTRASINRQVTQAAAPLTDPLREAVDEIDETVGELDSEIKNARRAMTIRAANGQRAPSTDDGPNDGDDGDPAEFGTWSGGEKLDE